MDYIPLIARYVHAKLMSSYNSSFERTFSHTLQPTVPIFDVKNIAVPLFLALTENPIDVRAYFSSLFLLL